MQLPNQISALLSRFSANGFAAFVVGGCVRDALLGKTPTDWDICTAATPEEVIELFSDKTVLPTGLKHGTVTLLLGKTPIEITTFRQDGNYTDSRHPDKVFYTIDVCEDLKRRDFTINAMAFSPSTGLLDLFDGRSHLKKGILSCVGSPQHRFQEDALRILRALRFASVYGFQIEPQTASAIHNTKNGLTAISAERIWSELEKIFLGAHFPKILAAYPDVLGVLFPLFADFFIDTTKEWESFLRSLSKLPSVPALRLGGLFAWRRKKEPALSDEAYFSLCAASMQYLKMDKRSGSRLLRLIRLQSTPLPTSLYDTRTLVGQYGDEGFWDLLFWKSSQEDPGISLAEEFFAEIRQKNLCCNVKDLSINGFDLQAHGISDGKEIGNTLRRALAAVIAGKVPNQKDDLINFLFS